MSDPQPRLTLTFSGDGFRQGAVPLTVVAAKLQALQQAMFHAAAAASGHSGGRRGLWFNRFRSAAELTFASSQHSELVIEAELAADPLLHEDFNIGQQAVDLLFDVAVAVDRDNFSNLTLNRYDRDYMVRALEGLMPNSGDQYAVKLENCRPKKHPPVMFTAETRRRLKSYAAIEDQSFNAEEATIVGELIKIHVDAGEDKITVRWQQRNIDCFYGDALRDQIANLIAGSVVEVTGFATLNDRGQVDQIHQVVNVEHVSMEPLRIGRFEHGGRVCNLATPISVNIEYADGLWVYNHSGLNLWGYAERRENALTNLHADFLDLFTQIAEEDPNNLDGVAQQLRERLRTLVAPATGSRPDA
ncbi:MAG: hypothetical protein IT440_04170 [Phycisphaeraceae bacterium]|nr:hypothetical protein [Phycisphaeraceae bacterium]